MLCAVGPAAAVTRASCRAALLAGCLQGHFLHGALGLRACMCDCAAGCAHAALCFVLRSGGRRCRCEAHVCADVGTEGHVPCWWSFGRCQIAASYLQFPDVQLLWFGSYFLTHLSLEFILTGAWGMGLFLTLFTSRPCSCFEMH